MFVLHRRSYVTIPRRNAYAISSAFGGEFDYGIAYSAVWLGMYDAVEGAPANFAITRFTAIPAPGILAMMLVTGLAGFGQRRRQR